MKPEWKNYTIGALAMALVFVVGLLVFSRPGADEQAAGKQQDTSPQAIAEIIESGQAKLQQTLGEELAAMKTKIDQMEQKLEGLETPEEMQERLEHADVPPVEPPEIHETDGTDIADILAALRQVGQDDVPLRVVLPPDDEPVEDAEIPVELPQPDTAEDGTAPPDEPLVADVPDVQDIPAEVPDEPQPAEDIDKTFAELEAEAIKLADALEFQTALAILDSRPDITDTTYQAKRERAKRAVRLKAEQVFQADIEQAAKLAEEGRFAEAGRIYDNIARYGLPSMITEARRRIADLPVEIIETAPEPETEAVKPPETADPAIDPADADDPRIALYIAQLRDKNAAQHLRTQAAKELGVLKAAAAIPDLIKALEDRDWLLRIRAATSLAEMGDLRAVPALIRNLEHPMLPVRPAAQQALEKITGQEFGNDTRAWEEWWKAETGVEEPADANGEAQNGNVEQETVEYEPPKELDSFVSQIIILRESDNALVLQVRPDVSLKVGQKLNLLREGKNIAEVQVAVAGFGNATVKILNRTEDPLEEGDLVVVEKVVE